jgi:Ca2+/Na+ antiporter
MTTNQQVPRAGVWTRIAARGAAAIVAIVAGAASFEHIASVAIGAGERAWVGYSLPFAIDGLIVVGVAALLEDQRQGRHRRLSARLAVLVGVIATLAANVASAEPSWTARLVALAAPVSFLLSVEVLTRTGHKLSTPDDTITGGRASGDPPASAAPARPRQRAASRSRPTAAQRVAQAAAKTPTATSAEIAARLKVSERTVQRYRPHPPAAGSNSGNGVGGSARGGLAPVPPAAFARPATPERTDRAGAGT